MIEAQIADGDYVVVKRQKTASPGQMVVAQTPEGEATLKYWHPESNRIRLQPANPTMDPIYVKEAAVLGVVYIFGAWRCGAELRAVDPHWLMIALLVSWAGDTAAMYVGKALGRNKLAPRISPGKTVEGAVASVVGGTVGAVVYAHYLLPAEPLVLVAAIGAVANIAGQLGDLAESTFKRGAGVKDSGTTLPGHGGWLDRIDSSLFSVPAVYALLKFLES